MKEIKNIPPLEPYVLLYKVLEFALLNLWWRTYEEEGKKKIGGDV